MSKTRKNSGTARARNRLIKQNNTMQLKAVRKQNMLLMKALSRKKPSSFSKTIKANEKMQQRQIRSQNMSLARTLKRSGMGTSIVKKRMKIQKHTIHTHRIICQARGYFGRIFHTIQIGASRVILKFMSSTH